MNCLSYSFNPIKNSTPQVHNPSARIFPARDRVLDFGKHKGKMLGTLPSTYLKWISNNLRARDFLDWALLADQVLQDPFYQDRIEWELAQNILTGDINRCSSSSANESAASHLSEISERFGWDDKDKAAWSRIDFELLGTSKWGRIPRITHGHNGGQEIQSAVAERGKVEADLADGNGKRRERRERVKMKREKRSVVGAASASSSMTNSEDGFTRPAPEDKSCKDPFPGREAMLRKMMTPPQTQQRPIC